MHQPRRHLSQMHTTNYMPFIRKKTANCKKKLRTNGEGRPPPLSLPSLKLNTPLPCPPPLGMPVVDKDFQRRFPNRRNA